MVAGVTSRTQDLTTPPQGQGDVSYACVVHSNRGSYEPTWLGGLNALKEQYTPNGKFEVSSASSLYACKKYCDVGDVNLLVVRVDTGAKFAGASVINTDITLDFPNIAPTGTKYTVGSVFTHVGKSYICKVTETEVPEDNINSWLSSNCIKLNTTATKTDIAINYSTAKSIKAGTTLKSLQATNTVTFSGVTQYPAVYGVMETGEFVAGEKIFGFWQNAEDSNVVFGYGEVNPDGDSVTTVQAINLVENGTVVLPSDIVVGTPSFWSTVGGDSVAVSYNTANLKIVINTESYEAIKRSNQFPIIKTSGNSYNVGETLWYNNTPYICIRQCVVPAISTDTVLAPFVSLYFTVIGGITNISSEISQGWTEGRTSMDDYEFAEDEVLAFYGKNGGQWTDGISYTITNYVDDPAEIELKDCFKVTVYENGAETGSYIVTRKQGILDANGDSMYIEDVINKRSATINVKDNVLLSDDILPLSILTPARLTGGENGSYPTEAQMIQALDKIKDEKKYQYLILSDGGFTTKAYAEAISNVVNQRKGTYGAISCPLVASLSANALNDIVAYFNELSTIYNDKMYFAEYWGTEYDGDTGRNVYIPPTGSLGKLEAQTKANYGLYYPTAGWKRGVLDVDLVNKWEKGQMAILEKNKINFGYYKENVGQCVWNEATALGIPSYRQQHHIMKVLLDVIPKAENILEPFAFDLGQVDLFNKVTLALDSLWNIVEDNDGCTWFENTCSWVNNSQDTLDAQELRVWSEFTPVNAIKNIIVTYGLTNGKVRLVGISESNS